MLGAGLIFVMGVVSFSLYKDPEPENLAALSILQSVVPTPIPVEIEQYSKLSSVELPDLTREEVDIKTNRYALYKKAMEAKTAELQKTIDMAVIETAKARKEANRPFETTKDIVTPNYMPQFPQQSVPTSDTSDSTEDTKHPEDYISINRINSRDSVLLTVMGVSHVLTTGSSAGGIKLLSVESLNGKVKIQGLKSKKIKYLYLVPTNTRTRIRPTDLDNDESTTGAAG